MNQVKFVQSAPPKFERPPCPNCGARMWFAQIMPDKPGYDRRTFECRDASMRPPNSSDGGSHQITWQPSTDLGPVSRSLTSGEWVRTFAVITTDANELVADIHDRMPLILDPTSSSISLSQEYRP